MPQAPAPPTFTNPTFDEDDTEASQIAARLAAAAGLKPERDPGVETALRRLPDDKAVEWFPKRALLVAVEHGIPVHPAALTIGSAFPPRETGWVVRLSRPLPGRLTLEVYDETAADLLVKTMHFECDPDTAHLTFTEAPGVAPLTALWSVIAEVAQAHPKPQAPPK